MKRILLTLCALSFCYISSAQNGNSDSSRKKKTSHWVGMQANALIRQVFNFNGSGNTVNNPYLFTYSLMNNRHRIALDLGFGYTLIDAFNADGNTKSEKHNNDVYVRCGPMKMFHINNRFSGTIALHGLLMMLNDKTLTQNDFNSQIQIFRTTTTQWGVGGGPCAAIRFRIANRVFIGTEATYYFRIGNTKSTISSEIFFPPGGQTQNSYTKTDNDFRELIPTLPAALFLNIRF